MGKCTNRSEEQLEFIFRPGRFNQQKKLAGVSELTDSLDKGLRGHFDREETAVLAAFVEHGDRELVSSFRSLMQEHTQCTGRHTDNEQSHRSQTWLPTQIKARP